MRREVVVGPQDERAGHAPAAAPWRRSAAGTASRCGEVVAGVDDEVGLAGRPAPRTHSTLRRCAGIRCRSVMCSTRSGAAPGGSTGTVNRRSVNALRSTRRGVGEPAGADGEDSGGGQGGACHGVHRAHPRKRVRRPRVPRLRAMTDTSASTSRPPCSADLTDAMRSATRCAPGTLRMVLTAITNEEVAGHRGARAHRRRGPQGARQGGQEAPGGRHRLHRRGPAGARRARRRPSSPCSRPTCPPSCPTTSSRRWSRRRCSRPARPAWPQMGQVMKAAQPLVAGRAEGGRVAAVVKEALAG